MIAQGDLVVSEHDAIIAHALIQELQRTIEGDQRRTLRAIEGILGFVEVTPQRLAELIHEAFLVLDSSILHGC